MYPTISDDILQGVNPHWHKEFRLFLTTGEASEEFKQYLDETPECQQAVEAVLAAQFEDVKGSVPLAERGILAVSSARRGGRRGWFLATGTVMVGCVVGFLWMLSLYRRTSDENLALRERLHFATVADRHPLELLASMENELPNVAQWLGHEDPKVQERARLVLGKLPSVLKEAVPQLANSNTQTLAKLERDWAAVAVMFPTTAFSHDPDLQLLNFTAVLLKGPLAPSWEQTRQNIAHPNRDTRIGALQTLGKMGPAAEAAVPDLIKRLKDGQIDTGERRAIEDCLARISPETASSTSISVVDNIFVRIWQGELRAPSVGSRIRAAKELGDLGPRARQSWKQLYTAYEEEKDPWARWDMTVALKQIDPTAAERAGLPVRHEERFWTGPPQVTLQQRKVVGWALYGLDDEDADVRSRSAHVLWQLGSVARPTFPTVWHAYDVEQDAGTKTKLAETLKKIDPKEAQKKGIR